MKKKISFLLVFWLGLLSWVYAQNALDSIDFYEKNLDYAKAIRFVDSKNEILITQKKWSEYQELNLKLAKIYTKLNDPQRAIEVLYQCLQNVERSDKNKLKPELFLEMGTNYSLMKDSLKSRSHYHKSRILAEKTNNSSAQRNAYQNLFRLWALTNLDSAKLYLNRKFELDKIDNDPGGLAVSYNNFFTFYTLIDDFQTAKKYADSAYSLAKEHKISHAMITALTNYGYYYIVEKDDYQSAKKYYEELEENYGSEMTPTDLGNLYLNLGHVYAMLKDYKNSNHYHYLYIELSQQLTNDRVNDAVKAVELRYQIEKVEDEFREKEEEMIKAQTRKEILFYIVIAILLLSVVLGYFFYQTLKLRQKNEIRKIENQKQKELLNAMLDGQELERKNVAMVLHDQISATLASVGLHMSALTQKVKEELPEIEKSKVLLKDAQEQVRGLSHKLLPPVLAKLGFVEAVKTVCSQNSNEKIFFSFENKLLGNPLWSEDWNVKLYGMVLELIQNTIKHSKANNVFISLNETSKTYTLTVSDNGVGIPNFKKEKIGLGLSQIKNRLEFYNGKMVIITSDSGTTVSLIFPKP